jgi:hypothetical protein
MTAGPARYTGRTLLSTARDASECGAWIDHGPLIEISERPHCSQGDCGIVAIGQLIRVDAAATHVLQHVFVNLADRAQFAGISESGAKQYG